MPASFLILCCFVLALLTFVLLALVLLDVVGVCCCRLQLLLFSIDLGMFCFDDACFAMLHEEFYVVGFCVIYVCCFLFFRTTNKFITLIRPLCPYIDIYTWDLLCA